LTQTTRSSGGARDSEIQILAPRAANAPGKFLKSVEAYSTSVTGIYSTKPGVVGRRQTTSKNLDEVPMAMVGIVPTKVSAENGPIRPGDLLVTASTLGYAMKGTDRSRMLGAVLGKALGILDSGTGMIEVVVTLQCARVSNPPSQAAEPVVKCGYGSSDERSHGKATDTGRDSADCVGVYN
jgi:hypothetical protein